MAERLAAARREGVPLVILDIPLLFETRGGRGGGSADLVEAVVLVYAPEAVQVERIAARDGRPRAEALERVRAQMPIEEKRELADHVIDNTGPLEETAAQVRALYAALAFDPAEGVPSG
jgi:dephospho-CoA kinase